MAESGPPSVDTVGTSHAQAGPHGQGDRYGPRRALLDLISALMEDAFARLGEGIIMGTMPGYIRTFGLQNARYLQSRHVHCDGAQGAVAALTPSNFLSRATNTPYTMMQETKRQAVKRLHACEFQAAFADRSEFARAMMCRLHGAAYEGSVNALLENPEKNGYHVDVRSRILFGDPHCDFRVRSIKDRPDTSDQECPTTPVPQEELAAQTLHFYAAILVAFVDYLCRVLPEETVSQMVRNAAAAVGQEAAAMLPLAVRQDAPEAVLMVLSCSDRTAEPSQGAPPVIAVHQCPFEQPIRATTTTHAEALRQRVRQTACDLCTAVLQETAMQAAASANGPAPRIVRCSSRALGDDACRFEVHP